MTTTTHRIQNGQKTLVHLKIFDSKKWITHTYIWHIYGIRCFSGVKTKTKHNKAKPYISQIYRRKVNEFQFFFSLLHRMDIPFHQTYTKLIVSFQRSSNNNERSYSRRTHTHSHKFMLCFFNTQLYLGVLCCCCCFCYYCYSYYCCDALQKFVTTMISLPCVCMCVIWCLLFRQNEPNYTTAATTTKN